MMSHIRIFSPPCCELLTCTLGSIRFASKLQVGNFFLRNMLIVRNTFEKHRRNSRKTFRWVAILESRAKNLPKSKGVQKKLCFLSFPSILFFEFSFDFTVFFPFDLGFFSILKHWFSVVMCMSENSPKITRDDVAWLCLVFPGCPLTPGAGNRDIDTAIRF